jgi:hypothetical protein
MANGKLSSADLAPIPGGRLARNAAHSWNRMRQHIGTKTGVWIAPGGPRSSYRVYSDQLYFWNLYKSGRGNLAAYPGSSNHGWGLAVDVATTRMAQLINQYGAPFGWQKRWSDAPSEWWHFKYAANMDSRKADPKPKAKPKPKHPSAYLGPNESRHRTRLKKIRKQRKSKPQDAGLKRKLATEKDALRRSRAGIKKAAKGSGGWKAKHRKTRYDYLGRLIRNTAKK